MSDSNGLVTETVTGDTQSPAAPVVETAPVTLPDDHPLVKTLAATKDEIRSLKQANVNLVAQESAARQQASQYSEQLTQLRTELAQTRVAAENNEIAVQYGLSAEDATVLAGLQGDRTAKEALAQRLAGGYGADGVVRAPLPVPELGRVVTTDSDLAVQFERFFNQKLR